MLNLQKKAMTNTTIHFEKYGTIWLHAENVFDRVIRQITFDSVLYINTTYVNLFYVINKYLSQFGSETKF